MTCGPGIPFITSGPKPHPEQTPFMSLLSLPRLFFAALATATLVLTAVARPSVLIVDGRNNHDWRTTTDSLRATLESTGLFEVEVATAPEEKAPSGLRAPSAGDADFAAAKQRHEDHVRSARTKLQPEWDNWLPDFSRHATVILNYNGPAWPKPMQEAFIAYVRNGGAVLVVANPTRQ